MLCFLAERLAAGRAAGRLAAGREMACLLWEEVGQMVPAAYQWLGWQ